MCGRYVLHGPVSRYQDYFDARNLDGFELSYNVAPSRVMPVVRRSGVGGREFVLARWGLIPARTTDPTGSPQPINAKCETAAIKAMFRDAFRSRRVLVPADGFYEWQPLPGRRKQPYVIRLTDGSPMGLAGLLECWPGSEGDLWTFTVLTTDANPLVAPIHSRMPAIIAPENFDRWLDPSVSDIEELQSMLGPYPDRLMQAYPVSSKVSSPDNDGPELIESVEDSDVGETRSLFE